MQFEVSVDASLLLVILLCTAVALMSAGTATRNTTTAISNDEKSPDRKRDA
jgi:hypothetical protein